MTHSVCQFELVAGLLTRLVTYFEKQWPSKALAAGAVHISFFRWDISVVHPKWLENLVMLRFWRYFWPNLLNFFRRFKINSASNRKKQQINKQEVYKTNLSWPVSTRTDWAARCRTCCPSSRATPRFWAMRYLFAAPHNLVLSSDRTRKTLSSVAARVARIKWKEITNNVARALLHSSPCWLTLPARGSCFRPGRPTWPWT